jgi:hypothetical protein
MNRNLASLICASLLGGFTLAVNAAVIDFETDPVGAKGNGFSPAGHPLVSFTDTVGTGLDVGAFGSQGLGTRSLAVHDDSDSSKLRINFAAPMNFVSLMFGNDDPGFMVPTDLAWLELFNGATSIGLVSMAANQNDIMDQTISFGAGVFDRAEFWYGSATGNPQTGPQLGLAEVVDQIEYHQANGVPDSGSTLGLSVIALLGLAAIRRKLVG